MDMEELIRKISEPLGEAFSAADTRECDRREEGPIIRLMDAPQLLLPEVYRN